MEKKISSNPNSPSSPKLENLFDVISIMGPNSYEIKKKIQNNFEKENNNINEEESKIIDKDEKEFKLVLMIYNLTKDIETYQDSCKNLIKIGVK
jgi:formiminotetrahydrofolate cyclodeaminase